MKNAIIVGATSGIGLEVARIMRSEGVNIGVAGRREDRLRKFAEEGGNVVWQRIDVTDENAGGLLVDLAERMGGVDTILLVSGIGSQNRDLDPGIEIATAETNVVGFTRIVDAAFSYLKSNGGGHIGAVKLDSPGLKDWASPRHTLPQNAFKTLTYNAWRNCRQ